MSDYSGFVLTRQWRESNNCVELEFWLTTDGAPLQLIIPQEKPLFFIAEEQLPQAKNILDDFNDCSVEGLSMCNFSNQPVFACYFNSQRSLRQARELLLAEGLDPLESDINPYDRFLMERSIRGGATCYGNLESGNGYDRLFTNKVKSSEYYPEFKVLSLDIETAMQGIQLYSIGVYAVEGGSVLRKVFMVSEHPVGDSVDIFYNEKSLLLGFFDWLADYDPDIIIGWNVVNFDMWYLQKVCDKYRLKFNMGRSGTSVYWRLLDEESNRRMMTLSGRVVIDGIDLLKAATYRFESFSLNNVAGELLADEKLLHGTDRGNAITQLYLNDKQALAEYNLQDCKLVWDIFEKTKLINFAVARTQMTGLPLDRVGGSVASFDFRYLPLLHRQGYVAPNAHWEDEVENSPGGFVMESKPGLYNHVVVLDFKSLYPSIIRSFKIDPLGLVLAEHKEYEQKDLVPGFKGAWFTKNKNILPQLVAELWSERDKAKSNNDAALSQAIKIIMNSFYGVLGSGGCRFFDSRLATSITRRGHQIIQQTAKYIENESQLRGKCSVIYGDTDSVFIWLREATSDQGASDQGKILENQLNQWWLNRLQKEYGVESALEIQFETHYQRFLMPTIRGSQQGSKKRYAGVVMDEGGRKLVFKGLENVRTDWTRLAREFQSEVYRRVFFNEPYREYIQQLVSEVLNGKHDADLIYRKRLRRKLNEYQRNIPPHVQAARKAVAAGVLDIRGGDWVEYVITINGAEPKVYQSSLLDYQHYIDRQLAPAVDSILYFCDDSLSDIIDYQLGLF